VEMPDLPGTFGVVTDREDSEDLGSARFGDGSDEFPEALFDLGEIHRRRLVVKVGVGGKRRTLAPGTYRFRGMKEWVGEIRFSPEVIEKLWTKHDLTPEEVRMAVACGAHDEYRWDNDPAYGRRLIVEGSDSQGRIRAYLRPIDRRDGLWECLTAWREI
jgi:hypothetical protein